jgi:hypothetical protein
MRCQFEDMTFEVISSLHHVWSLSLSTTLYGIEKNKLRHKEKGGEEVN